VWHKRSGDFVEAGDPLFTLETDKVSTEITAEKAGVLDALVPEGHEAKIGEVVATIDDSKEAPPEEKKEEKREEPPEKKEPGKKKEEPAAEKKRAEEKEKKPPEKERPLSPAVRRVVEAEELEPAEISGTGKGGRLTKADVLAAVQERGVADSSAVALAKAEEKIEPLSRGYGEPDKEKIREAEGGRATRKRMSPLRRKIAAQLVMSQQTTATLTTFNECDMSAVQEMRKKTQEEFTKKHGVKLGLMSFFIKAAVEALKAVPVVNGRIEDEDFIQNNFYDVGVAVGTERGLIVPVIRAADKKSFADLEREIADYAEKARSGRLKLEDLQGGTFTISNGGVYGSLLSTPILNPPQTGILGLHKIMPRPVAIDGKVEVRPMMYLALSYDHRAIDGKEAVTFLIKVKEGIEDPKKLPLDF
jgi:2-oxoglutarate dehydrogenase E2 component (dihydrolipoamide succinyltransferase)